MPLRLTARTAGSNARRLTLRLGQEARVGRSQWVELSLPDDDALADEHFVVRCDYDAVVEAIGARPSLIVAGAAHKRLPLSDHDGCITEFVAGNTSFSIRWSPDFLPDFNLSSAMSDSEPNRVTDEATATLDDAPRIADVSSVMSLSDAAKALQIQPDQAVEYLRRIVAAGLHDDAIRFIAGFLPPMDGIQWAIQTGCLDHETPATLVDDMVRWSTTGAESDRVIIQQKLSESQLSNIAKWIAQAITYTGGSLAPNDQPVIRPPGHLCGISILTAHRWAIAKRPDRSAAVAQWIESGIACVAQMKKTLPEPSEHNRRLSNVA